ncbi:glutamate racemase [Marinobacter fuscus]|uniref:Glutamate racemase n=1 Tax=Marinobacter fuscus TaxID=2109942 RepID=A0A2T1KKM6_9GAMM|nr:glutamate racemase [Marinobacter fuscus]PSF10681.1 glutamate racemase [Marinobacter fuscus]
MPDRRPRVLVFDSGIGGLSVAACVHRQTPGVELVYLADNAGFPYGDKSGPAVIERCCSLVRACLRQYPSDVIVVACNTASTIVLPHLRAMTPVPVVGVVPAIKPAAGLSANRRIGVLATPATVQRPYLDELIRDFAGDCRVIRLGHPALVQWAEGLVEGNQPPQAEVDAALAPLSKEGVDTVVLGCTHYPLLLPWLRRSLPEVEHWVDSGDAIARRVAFLLESSCDGFSPLMINSGSDQPAVLCACFSGPAPEGIEPFMSGLGLPLSQAPRAIG